VSDNIGPLVDSPAPIAFRQFDEDRASVLDRAAEAGLVRILNPGVDVPSTRRALALAAAHPGVVEAAAGIHPMAAKGDPTEAVAALKEAAAEPRVVAVGETGIDLFKKYHPLETQRAYFAAQLGLAQELDLPIIIHCRDAFPETFDVIRSEGIDRLRGVMHCFSGGPRDAEPFEELGMYFGIALNVTYPRAASLREAVARLPLDRLLVETDCPFLPPERKRGKRNEPAYVRQGAAMIAALKHVPEDTVARATTENAFRLFDRMKR